MVVSFGELLWDLLPTGRVLGGAPGNFAYRLNALGTPTTFVSRVGDDDLGREAIAKVARGGLATDYIQIDSSKPTGTVPVKLDANGSPDFTIIEDVAFDYIEFTNDIAELGNAAQCICYGALGQRGARSRETLHRLLTLAPQALKVCDLNLRRNCFTRESIAQSLDRADVLKLNDDEAAYLAHEFALGAKTPLAIAGEAIARWRLKTCVITCGSGGAVAISDSADAVEVPGRKVTVVDTCGAGDAFAAGFIHKLLAGASLRESCEFGNRLGSIVATQAGATEPINLAQLQP